MKPAFIHFLIFMPSFFVCACGILSTGSSIDIQCGKALSNSTVVQSLCSPSASPSTSSSPSASPSASSDPSPSPTPTVTVTPLCSYSEQHVYATVSDLSIVFAEAAVPYTKTVTASTCMGINVGPAGTFSAANVNGDGATINSSEVTGGFTIAGTNLTWTSTSVCTAGVLVTTTLDAGTIAVFPASGITLDFTYTFDPDGC